MKWVEFEQTVREVLNFDGEIKLTFDSGFTGGFGWKLSEDLQKIGFLISDVGEESLPNYDVDDFFVKELYLHYYAEYLARIIVSGMRVKVSSVLQRLLGRILDTFF